MINNNNYFKRVLANANHHAYDVDLVIYPLWFHLNSNKNLIELKEGVLRKSTQTLVGNSLKCLFASGKTYYFNYDHTLKSIVMKQKNNRGQILHTFNDSSREEDIEAIIGELA